MPNYNHAAYLPCRLESIAAQTFQDYEWILLDDASTDASVEILQEWQKKHADRCRLIVNDTNSGSPFYQWNKGVQESTGKYIWIAESDDACAPTLLEENVCMMEADSRLGMAFCQSVLIDECANKMHSFNEHYKFIFKTDRWEKAFHVKGEIECTQYLIHHNTLPNASGILFRKEAYLSAGGGNPRFKLNGDWMLYARILTNWDLGFCPKELNYFRLHNETQRQKANKGSYAYTEILEIQDYIKNKLSTLAIEDYHKARKEVSHWWIGSLYRQSLFSKNYWQVNRQLYQIFKPYHKALWWNISYHGIYIGIRFILKRLGLYKAAKTMRNKLFPGKYFNP